MSRQLVPIVDKNGVATSRWKNPEQQPGLDDVTIPQMRSAASTSLFVESVPGTVKGSQITRELVSELRAPFDPQMFVEVENQRRNKPWNGLWASERHEGYSAWESVAGAFTQTMHRHEVKVHPQANVLIIDSWADYTAACDAWPLDSEQIPGKIRPDYEAMAADGVDAVYMTQDGVGQCDSPGGPEAYEGDYQRGFRWEIPSICFLNPDAVQAAPAQTIIPPPTVEYSDGDYSGTQRLDKLHWMLDPGVYRAKIDGQDVDVLIRDDQAEVLGEDSDLSDHPDAAFAHGVRTARYFGATQQAIDALYALKEQYPVLGAGRNRLSFDDGQGMVIKVPITPEGSFDNVREAEHNDDYIPLAWCYAEELHGIPVVRMEKVTPYQGGIEGLPEWCYSVDSFQVGYNSRGDLVAYDL